MLKLRLLLSAGLVLCVGTTLQAQASGVEGIWRTESDSRGQTALVTARPCGDAFCGAITSVLDPNGRPIQHPNIGRRVFWEMKPVATGTYQGKAYVPAFKKNFPAEMRLSGRNLVVRGCAGPVCKSQKWQRAD